MAQGYGCARRMPSRRRRRGGQGSHHAGQQRAPDGEGSAQREFRGESAIVAAEYLQGQPVISESAERVLQGDPPEGPATEESVEVKEYEATGFDQSQVGLWFEDPRSSLPDWVRLLPPDDKTKFSSTRNAPSLLDQNLLAAPPARRCGTRSKWSPLPTCVMQQHVPTMRLRGTTWTRQFSSEARNVGDP